MATRKVRVEIELPEGVELEDLLRGVKYRVLTPTGQLEEILGSARRKKARIGEIPAREEIYADRAGH